MLTAAELVARIRRKSGETQEGLAHRLNVSFPTVNAWERGRTTPRPIHRRQLEALADELGIVHAATVLVIDDDPVSGELVAAASSMVDSSIATEVSLSGWEGLVQCGALKPQLLFLDILMPGIDGFEVARRLPAIGSLDEMAVVFVTSSQDPTILDRARRIGHDLLAKPLDIDVLADTIRTKLGIQEV